MRTVDLRIPSPRQRSYPILIGAGAARELPRILKDAKPSSVAVLCDTALREIADAIAKLTSAAGVIPVKTGEASKTMGEVERIAAELQKLGADRSTVLLCVGGGMLTDLGGFVAAVFLRGIRVIQVPTSMLAMVDASVGGKTGVDLEHSKNIIGCIHHPLAVIADIDFLRTLPDTPLREGLVEAIKMAAILDAGAFEWFERHLAALLKRDPETLAAAIESAVKMKAGTVGEDERDNGRRMLLNFGHTVGHAAEALSGFAIPHGQAVSIGMMVEMRVAGTKGWERVARLMKAMDMPLEIPQDQTNDALWQMMLRDKKTQGGVVRIAVPDRIGHGDVRPMTFEEFLAVRHG